MIKFTKLFFALILMVSLTACGGDDDASPSSDSLLGTWTATSFSANVETTSTISGTETKVTTAVTGSNFDYDVTFTATGFTTAGGYTTSVNTTLDGMALSTSVNTTSGVAGVGTYTTDNDQITIVGAFYDYEVNGMSITATSPEQTATYEIDANGVLTFSQNEEITANTQSTMSTSRLVSTSTWVRK